MNKSIIYHLQYSCDRFPRILLQLQHNIQQDEVFCASVGPNSSFWTNTKYIFRIWKFTEYWIPNIFKFQFFFCLKSSTNIWPSFRNIDSVPKVIKIYSEGRKGAKPAKICKFFTLQKIKIAFSQKFSKVWFDGFFLWLQQFSVSPRHLSFGFRTKGFVTKGLRRGLENTIKWLNNFE